MCVHHRLTFSPKACEKHGIGPRTTRFQHLSTPEAEEHRRQGVHLKLLRSRLARARQGAGMTA